MAITTIGALISTLSAVVIAQSTRPEIFQISPTNGPEGSRVEITGKNFQGASAVLLGTSSAAVSLISPETLIILIPHQSITSTITVDTPQGRASSPFAFVIANDPRVPDEVSYKDGYVNAIAPPRNFKSALLWGIAIVVTRVPGHESVEMEIASTQLICRVDGKGVILNDNQGNARGGIRQGLYCRWVWTIGACRPSPTAWVETITKPEPGIGISLRRSGRMRRSQISEAHNSKKSRADSRPRHTAFCRG